MKRKPLKTKVISKVKGLSVVAKVAIVAALLIGGLAIGGVLTYTSYTYKEQLSVPYTTKSIEDDTLLTGSKKVVTAGVDGTKSVTYSVTKADGVELSKNIIDDHSIKKPIGAVVRVGILDKKQTNEDEVIPFDKQQVEDPNSIQGFSSISQAGVNGTKVNTFEILSVKDVTRSKALINAVITKPSISQITKIGINYRVGAICGDGWRSYATGSGACSSHGGVESGGGYWLYEYCSTLYRC